MTTPSRRAQREVSSRHLPRNLRHLLRRVNIDFIAEMPMLRAKAKRRPVAGFAEEDRPFVHDEIMRGIAARRVKKLIDRGVLGAKQVYRVIPERTFGRRIAKGEVLKPAEADAIGRLIRISDEAEKTFGDADFAHKWLSYPNPALRDRIPIEMAETDAGAREVETILTRIAYGVFS